MIEKVNILGIGIDNIRISGALSKIDDFLANGERKIIFTPNSEIIMRAKNDSEYFKVINSADILIPDGIGVVLASKILGKPLSERVAGFDLLMGFINNKKEKTTIYILGGKPGVAEKASKKIMQLNSNIIVRGFHDGYFDEKFEKEIIFQINSLKVDFLLVALGAPKQEKWIYQNINKLDVKICMGVGGSIDILSGQVKRAPKIFIKFGLEWFYRLLNEPWRFIRMMELPKFLIYTIISKFNTKLN